MENILLRVEIVHAENGTIDLRVTASLNLIDYWGAHPDRFWVDAELIWEVLKHGREKAKSRGYGRGGGS